MKTQIFTFSFSLFYKKQHLAYYQAIMVGLLLLCIECATIYAQQDTRYSQYMFNGLMLNPAYAGSANRTSLNAVYRRQWLGVEGAPQSILLSGHGAVGGNQQFGLGGGLEYDEIGVHNRFNAFASYAYKLKISENSRLSLGIQGGILYLRSQFTDVHATEGRDITFQQNTTDVLPNFGLGIYYYTPNFYIGAAIPHLLNHKLFKKEELSTVFSAQQFRHYFFTAGVILPIGEHLKLKPTVLAKVVPKNAPTQFDASVSLLIKEILWVGSSFRFNQQFNPESLDLMLAVRLKSGLTIGYAYGLTLTDLSNGTSGSHEVMLNYDFGRKGETVRPVRYF